MSLFSEGPLLEVPLHHIIHVRVLGEYYKNIPSLDCELTVSISFSLAFSLMAISLLLSATVTKRWLQAHKATLPWG